MRLSRRSQPDAYVCFSFVLLTAVASLAQETANQDSTRETATPGVTVAPGTLVGAATEPTVISANPSHRATNVPTSTNTSENLVTGTAVTATFSQPMDPATVNSLTFTVKDTTGGDVSGTVVMNEANTVATFTPTS